MKTRWMIRTTAVPFFSAGPSGIIYVFGGFGSIFSIEKRKNRLFHIFCNTRAFRTVCNDENLFIMKLTPEQLNEMIRGCRKGKNESFQRLLDLYGKRCYGFFYRMCGDVQLSEDLLSELFVKLVEKIDKYKDGSFETWLFTIAANLFRDHLRHKYRQQRLLEQKQKLLEIEGEPDSQDDGIDSDALSLALSKLDEETAELITLRYYSEMSFKELAEMRGEPIGTTLSKVHRGLKRLKELMGDTL